ncbi:MAG: PAS domain-containing sensor histidine kinase [Deltaproteobacteria bacterium]|jgi:PAS domain S-box-containing protein|nr:PAS domain-containing sensor histidine kinase [Deltaproteobacteria bacterium]
METTEKHSDLTFYKFVIRSLPVAVVTVDSELKVTGFNPWAEGLTGYSAEEALGRYCGKILQGGMCQTECPLRQVLKNQHRIIRIETTVRSKWGETIPVRMNTAALLGEDGKLIGGLEAFQDISRLKALEREKANLISMFAHDMKSPLVTIQGFASRLLARTSDLGPEKQDRYLEIIRKEAAKLEFLVDDFLELSRLQTGKLKLNFSATSLDKLLLELFEAYQPRGAQAGIELKLERKEALPIIEADADRLRRVFSNLLDNALKFAKEIGTVTIATEQTDRDVRIKIIDEGIGIDERELLYVFDPFHRGRDVDDREGFGLGLAAVKTIVEGHKGRVIAESELGKGSAFTVVLPKGRINETF